jgi:hypothetical protein
MIYIFKMNWINFEKGFRKKSSNPVEFKSSFYWFAPILPAAPVAPPTASKAGPASEWPPSQRSASLPTPTVVARTGIREDP